jgi:type II secretory pathway component PulJ
MRAPNTAIYIAAAIGLLGNQVQANDLRTSQLEQEVRELQRMVQQQARRIEALETMPMPRRDNTSQLPARTAPSAEPPTAWLDVANWDSLRLGMPMLDAIRLLGPPSTLRKSNDGTQQTLLYALELGAGHFLAGHVLIVDGRVNEIHKPALK